MHPEDTCEKCGGPNITWFIASHFWNQYAGNYGILCPVCFIKQAESSGFIPTSWQIAPEGRISMIDDEEVTTRLILYYEEALEWAAVQVEHRIRILGPNINPATKQALEELVIIIKSGPSPNEVQE